MASRRNKSSFIFILVGVSSIINNRPDRLEAKKKTEVLGVRTVLLNIAVL